MENSQNRRGMENTAPAVSKIDHKSEFERAPFRTQVPVEFNLAFRWVAHPYFGGAFGGKFLLRIEDIDGTRSRAEHVAAIIEDMQWLGLQHDGEVIFQSQRIGAYAAAVIIQKITSHYHRSI